MVLKDACARTHMHTHTHSHTQQAFNAFQMCSLWNVFYLECVLSHDTSIQQAVNDFTTPSTTDFTTHMSQAVNAFDLAHTTHFTSHTFLYRSLYYKPYYTHRRSTPFTWHTLPAPPRWLFGVALLLDAEEESLPVLSVLRESLLIGRS